MTSLANLLDVSHPVNVSDANVFTSLRWGIEVILHAEQVQITTQVVPVERVRMVRRVITTAQTITEPVRSEQIGLSARVTVESTPRAAPSLTQDGSQRLTVKFDADATSWPYNTEPTAYLQWKIVGSCLPANSA